MPDTIIPTWASRPATGQLRRRKSAKYDAAPSVGPLTRLARRVLVNRLDRLPDARITIVEAGLTQTFGQGKSTGDSAGNVARSTIHVHDPGFYRDVLLGGVNGAAESFIAGGWTCDDLPVLVRIFARNLQQADTMKRGPARLAEAVARCSHWLNRNTLSGSRRNIQAHYDLGNDFFELFLDSTMTYSSAVFDEPAMTLAEAQQCKYDRICRTLDLQPHHHVIEIGSGWGGFAIHAAQQFGCRVTTTTISDRQYELALARVHEHGLEDRVTVLQKDYRELQGQYDRLVSIEMIEAVGSQFYQAYFRQCGRLLKPDGSAVIQAITIADQRYERARRHVDFIKRYVFPGSCIPSITAMCDAMTSASDLRLTNLDDLTPHYATTLRHWRRRLMGRQVQVLDLGYPESLLRLWDFYLSYCEGGFAERTIGVVHMHLTKPTWRGGV